MVPGLQPRPGPSETRRAVEQDNRFCETTDGVRVVYGTTGSGLPVVAVRDWLTHLDLDWTLSPWADLYRVITEENQLIRYDLPGVGLSGGEAYDYSVPSKLGVLEAVVDAAELERFVLLGISFGGATAVAYASRHPERVAALVLYGSYSTCQPDVETQAKVDALETLIRGRWTSRDWFEQSGDRPSGSADERELGKAAAPPETSAELFASLWNLDVSREARVVAVPTLVVHRREDKLIPFDWGRDLASQIPGARFQSLTGTRHAIDSTDPEWESLRSSLLGFVAEHTVAQTAPDGLTPREVEVLRLLAQGNSNRAIADALSLSVHTVERHVANCYRKVGAHGRAEATVYALRHDLA